MRVLQLSLIRSTVAASFRRPKGERGGERAEPARLPLHPPLDAGRFCASLDVPWSVSACCVSTASSAETAEPIEMPFGGGPTACVRVLDEGAHWRHLSNAIDRSIDLRTAAIRAIATVSVATCLRSS